MTHQPSGLLQSRCELKNSTTNKTASNTSTVHIRNNFLKVPMNLENTLET